MSKLKFKRFAAIDIGSNAIRLLIANIWEHIDGPMIVNSELTRVPIRLGSDSFERHRISESKIKRLEFAMKGFWNLMQANKVVDYMACATSAMREAGNGHEIVDRIKSSSNIQIEIIDGKKEAEIIFKSHTFPFLKQGKNYLYADVGGGSTELTLFNGDEIVASHSFDVGTIRIMRDFVEEAEWKAMKAWIQQLRKNHNIAALIGSGGNISKLYKMSQQKAGLPLTFSQLSSLRGKIVELTLEDRIEHLQLKPDRAEVIVPASDVFLSLMKWTKCRRAFVPKIGLADGIIRAVYERYHERPIKGIRKLGAA